MLVPKLKLPAAGGLVLAAVAGGLLAADPPKPPPAADPPKPVARAAPKPLPKGPNKILVSVGMKLVLVDPDGKNPVRVSHNWDKFAPLDAKLTPDGTGYAALYQFGLTEDIDMDTYPGHGLHVRKLSEPEPGADTGAAGDVLTPWSPDGTRLVVTRYGKPHDLQAVGGHYLYDARTKTTTELKLPKNHVVTGWAPGDRLLTTAFTGRGNEPRVQRLWLMNLDGTEYKALTDGKTTSASWGVMSPDGKRVLCGAADVPTKEVPDPPARGTVVLDVATGKYTPVADVPLNGDLRGFCWSPDGKRIAYAWKERVEGPPEERINKETSVHLVVCDPDGGNAKTILSETGKEFLTGIGEPDWR